jgi:hypothetical protein
MRKLPRLQYLNGLEVDKDAMEDDSVAVASATQREGIAVTS